MVPELLGAAQPLLLLSLACWGRPLLRHTSAFPLRQLCLRFPLRTAVGAGGGGQCRLGGIPRRSGSAGAVPGGDAGSPEAAGEGALEVIRSTCQPRQELVAQPCWLHAPSVYSAVDLLGLYNHTNDCGDL